MGTYGSYETDKQLEKNGIMLDLGESGTYIVARSGGANKKYSELVRKLTQRYRRQIANGTLSIDIADRITIEAFSKTILLGWVKKDVNGCEYDVTGEDGNPLPYSTENAKKLLTDLPDLFADIKACADEATGYRMEVIAEEGKPLLSHSGTPSITPTK